MVIICPIYSKNPYTIVTFIVYILYLYDSITLDWPNSSPDKAVPDKSVSDKTAYLTRPDGPVEVGT